MSEIINDCLFCKIAQHQIPAKILYEDDDVTAFSDLNPQAPVHFLVIPKKHIPSLMDASAEDAALLGKLLFVAQKVLKDAGCEERGGRFVLNCKADGEQTVPHLHVHALGKRQMGWPPG
jgi:histidine triad (HIT) family protein